MILVLAEVIDRNREELNYLTGLEAIYICINSNPFDYPAE